MRIIKVCVALGCALIISGSGINAASAATIANFDSGWYTNTGFTAGVNNINVGSSNLSGAVYHNWLAFDVTGFGSQTITSATLTFYGGNGNNTSSTSETLGLFDYTGSIDALISNSQNNVGIFTDLGNGNSYGAAVIGSGPIQQFSVTLSQSAIAGLNAAAENPGDARFVIGGSLQSISGPFANEQLFAIFGPQAALAPAAFLTLEASAAAVPEPSSWAMMILGFGIVGFTARRKRKLPNFASLDPTARFANHVVESLPGGFATARQGGLAQQYLHDQLCRRFGAHHRRVDTDFGGQGWLIGAVDAGEVLELT